MTDQEVTYTTLRFHKTSGLQNPVRLEETQRPRDVGHRECSVPWKLIVIILGILCFLLLVTVAVLVRHIFRYGQEKHEQEKTLNNLCQEYHVMKNDSSLMEEMLRNKSSECKALNDSLHSLNREQNRCLRKTRIVLDCSQNKDKQVEGHWFCCGTKCYYFIMDNQPWNGCKQICQACNLFLLKIDDEDELKFLKPQLQGNIYWIALTYDKSKEKSQRIDNGPPKLAQEEQIFIEDLSLCHLIPVEFCVFFPWFIFSDIDCHDSAARNSVHNRKKCTYLSSFYIQEDDCARTHGCICEKRLSKFPIPGSCVKGRTQTALQSDEEQSEEMF
ncbi:LOW QUALITY PROTEIN: killer cell lectin-like receptor 2 [Mus pahari]|uniref:LOW QUALITY PROTEIN: killer cell lectin-like receptor 2 n=1 Tax=Mus pahari TaxID=10093 RepID=UPI001114BE45|nr:LOW QUALITY PROTEIN: killer cell lectin-like receptor 2 [Mus pahari]